MSDDKELDVRVAEIESLLVDPLFLILEREAAESNFFDIIGRSWDELTHSRILTWLLNPNESHGLGTVFTSHFLMETARIAKGQSLESLDYGEMMKPLEISSISDVMVQPEYTLSNSRRPDIVLWSDRDNWLCVIENKIGALEGSDQTTDYYISSKTPPLSKYHYRLFIYLSPSGSRPLSPHFVPVSYRTVFDVLRAIPNEKWSQLGLLVKTQYMKCIEGTIMKKDKFHETCREIYRKHRRAIDTLELYGSSSLLAAKVGEGVLNSLSTEVRTNEGWSSSKGSDWIALWPNNWPTKRGNYPAYYGIWTLDDSCFDKIKIGLGFDEPHGALIRKKLAETGGYTLIDQFVVTANKVTDVDHATEEGVRIMISLIRQTLPQFSDPHFWEVLQPPT